MAPLVDVQSRNELAAIDPATNRVIRRVGLSGCDHDHGLYLDPATRRAFVACDGNNRLLVVKADSGQVLQTFGVGDGPDVLAFDPGLHRLYVASENGVDSVFDETLAFRLTELGRAHLADNAHSVAVDPTTHRVYLPIRSSQPPSAGRDGARMSTDRPTFLTAPPNSRHLPAPPPHCGGAALVPSPSSFSPRSSPPVARGLRATARR